MRSDTSANMAMAWTHPIVQMYRSQWSRLMLKRGKTRYLLPAPYYPSSVNLLCCYFSEVWSIGFVEFFEHLVITLIYLSGLRIRRIGVFSLYTCRPAQYTKRTAVSQSMLRPLALYLDRHIICHSWICNCCPDRRERGSPKSPFSSTYWLCFRKVSTRAWRSAGSFIPSAYSARNISCTFPGHSSAAFTSPANWIRKKVNELTSAKRNIDQFLNNKKKIILCLPGCHLYNNHSCPQQRSNITEHIK